MVRVLALGVPHPSMTVPLWLLSACLPCMQLPCYLGLSQQSGQTRTPSLCGQRHRMQR